MSALEKQLSFAENFALSGAAAVISKTAAAPIERVKLMVQNQDEMIKAGALDRPYKGVVDCTVRTYRSEGEHGADIIHILLHLHVGCSNP